MSLNIQIQTIAYTFLFGIYFALIFNLLYKILFTFKSPTIHAYIPKSMHLDIQIWETI